MAVRRPVYLDGTSIRDMTDAQITAVKQRCVFLFGGSNRPVNLSYTAGNAGNLNRMYDTRDTAGAEVSNSSSFGSNSPAASNDGSNALPGNPAAGGASTKYDYINMSTADGSPSEPADTNNIAFPLYQESTGILRSMTRDDMYDTFINDAIDILVDGNDRDGTYRISTQSTTLAAHTRVHASPIFVDQRFNASTVHGGLTSTTTFSGILPLSSVDQPTTILSYYLWRTNQGTAYGTPSIVLPVKTDTNQDFVQYSAADFDTLLENLLFYSASSRTNYRIRYEINATGEDALTISDNVSALKKRGDAMVDTTLDADVQLNEQDGDTYRSQNLPTGGAQTETTYVLRIYRK